MIPDIKIYEEKMTKTINRVPTSTILWNLDAYDPQ